MLQNDANSGTSTSLTVSDASSRLEGLLSDDLMITEDEQPSEQPTAPEADKPEGESTPDEPEEPAAEEPEESEEGEGETPEEPQAPQTYHVKVDGEEVEVTLDELLKGYSRTADYTRKTQKLADERAAFQQEVERVVKAELPAMREERTRYATQVAQLAEVLQSLTAEPDWDKLREENPAAFAEEYAEWDRQQKRIEKLKAERDRAMQDVANDRLEQMREMLRTEQQSLVEKLPTWKQPEVAKKERDEIVSYLKDDLGLSPAEIDGIVDHRVILTVRKAMLFDRAQKAPPATKPTKTQDAPRVVKPGPAPSVKREVSDLTRAKQRLAKTHSVRDAAAAIEMLLGDD